MDLATAFQKYAQKGDGQLILKFSALENLCKISVEAGEAVYIKLGNMDPEKALDFISGKEPVDVSFIKGFVPKKKLPKPITDKILSGGSGGGVQPVSVHARTESMTEGEQVSPRNVNRTINAFVDIVGPLGVVLIENLLKKIGYTKDGPMPADDYAFMLDELYKDIPQDMRTEFIEATKQR